MNDPEPELWSRYLAGSKAIDDLFSKGYRCPSNATGVRCLCGGLIPPKKDICRYWVAVEKIAREIGGATWEVVGKLK